jgi:hypothetical protein
MTSAAAERSGGRGNQAKARMLALSEKWAPILRSQPETGMGYQIASVFLMDGRRFDYVTIVGGYITKVGASSAIPFNEAEIGRIVVDHGK